MNRHNKIWRMVIACLCISILAELVVFNYKALFSLFAEEKEVSEFFVGEGLIKESENRYHIDESRENVHIELNNIDQRVQYIYLDVQGYDVNKDDIEELVPVNAKISIIDEGYSSYYEMPKVSFYGGAEKYNYIRLHSYGNIKNMKIDFSETPGADLQINNVILNAVVPLNLSVKRIAVMFAMLLLLCMIKRECDSGDFCKCKISRKSKLSIVCIVLALNVLFFYILVRLNTGFLEPRWEHHYQYERLAVALTEGKTNIDVNFDGMEELQKLDNPYDSNQRDTIEKVGRVWDTAYYDGKLYVYFGVVPVMLFYLPYYLVTGSGFPTWIGVFIMGVWILLAVFYFLHQLMKRWFPNTSFWVYLILSILMGNTIGTIQMMLRPDFYSLPIITALAFTITGLGLWISAANGWDEERQTGIYQKRTIVKMSVGSLFMALVAGCRPQFLVGSFLIFPVFWNLFCKDKCNHKNVVIKLAALIFPYILVAIPLMCYNYIRFGSVIDFGANYNLTTNDMTLRGFHAGRIVDGIFCYLFQLPNVILKFPYLEKNALVPTYIGQTIAEGLYGGVFFTQFFLLFIFCAKNIKNNLKQKKLWLFFHMCNLLALVVVIADTEMAGILTRYNADFTWLFLIAATFVFLQLLEKRQTVKEKNLLVLLSIICLFVGVIMALSIGIQQGELISYSYHNYYRLRAFFEVF